MMKTKKGNFKKNAPAIVIDESLDKYDNVILFPEKQAKYNEMLRAAGHPKDKITHQKA